jgi:hypothetical protein
MAYENYSPVSWTNGTPITGDRLQQMTTNIEQVKDATDDNPKGLIKIKTITSNSSDYSDFLEKEVIALKDESGTGGADNRVSVSVNRYYRVILNFSGIAIKEPGGEDSTFNLKICSGTFGGANSTLATYKITIPPYTFLNAASNATPVIADHSVKQSAFYTRVGSGTYAVVEVASTAISNGEFFASISRTQGASNNSPTAYFIQSADAKCQLYVEDIGGAV